MITTIVRETIIDRAQDHPFVIRTYQGDRGYEVSATISRPNERSLVRFIDDNGVSVMAYCITTDPNEADLVHDLYTERCS